MATSELTPQTSAKSNGYVRIVILLMLLIGVGHFNRISISVAGAHLIRTDAIQDTAMGQVYTGFLAVYTLMMIPGGWFIDRFGAKTACLVVLVGSALGMIGTGLVGLYLTTPLLLWAGLMIVRPLMGLTNSPMHPGAARLVGEWIPPKKRQFVNGLVTFAACVGISATYVVFGGLMDWVGWAWAAILCGVATWLLAAAWTLGAGNRPAGTTSSSRRSSNDLAEMLGLLNNRSLVLLAISYGAFGYFQYLFFYWTELYLQDELHFSVGASRLATTLLTLIMGLGMMFGGWLADYLHSNSSHARALALVPGFGLALAATAFIVGIYCGVPALTLACFALAVAAGGACEGPCWTLAVDLGKERGGAAAAILNTGGNLGGLFAPLLTPYISAAFGRQMSFGVGAAICFAGAVLWLWIKPAPPRVESPESIQILA